MSAPKRRQREHPSEPMLPPIGPLWPTEGVEPTEDPNAGDVASSKTLPNGTVIEHYA